AIAMLAILMIQLQSFSRLALVFATAPLGLIGATGALLISNRPFGFVALLGLIALAGMIMRNTVILVDQIDRDIAAGHGRHRAIIDATVRRARPVILTALAAILGMIPLAGSIFWGPMAITIMGGLLVATALTLLVVPALYALWFRVRSEETIDAPAFHPQRLESFHGHLEPIRIAAQWAKVAAASFSAPCASRMVMASMVLMASSTSSVSAMMSAPSEMRCRSMLTNAMIGNTIASVSGMESATMAPARTPRLRMLTPMMMAIACHNDVVNSPIALRT